MGETLAPLDTMSSFFLSFVFRKSENNRRVAELIWYFVTSGGRSVGMAHLRTQATEFF
jgi:hypothetical protein